MLLIINNSFFFQIIVDHINTSIDIHLTCIYSDFRISWLFIRRTYSSKIFDLPCSGFLIQSFWISFFTFCKITLDIDLNKIFSKLISYNASVFFIRRDKCSYCNNTRINKKIVNGIRSWSRYYLAINWGLRVSSSIDGLNRWNMECNEDQTINESKIDILLIPSHRDGLNQGINHSH